MCLQAQHYIYSLKNLYIKLCDTHSLGSEGWNDSSHSWSRRMCGGGLDRDCGRLQQRLAVASVWAGYTLGGRGGGGRPCPSPLLEIRLATPPRRCSPFTLPKHAHPPSIFLWLRNPVGYVYVFTLNWLLCFSPHTTVDFKLDQSPSEHSCCKHQ